MNRSLVTGLDLSLQDPDVGDVTLRSPDSHLLHHQPSQREHVEVGRGEQPGVHQRFPDRRLWNVEPLRLCPALPVCSLAQDDVIRYHWYAFQFFVILGLTAFIALS